MSANASVLLADYRKRMGWSQSELSRRCGYVPSSISLAERGRLTMTREFAETTADALALDPYDRAQFIAAAGYWPWPGVSFKDAVALMSCGSSLDESAFAEAV